MCPTLNNTSSPFTEPAHSPQTLSSHVDPECSSQKDPQWATTVLLLARVWASLMIYAYTVVTPYGNLIESFIIYDIKQEMSLFY